MKKMEMKMKEKIFKNLRDKLTDILLELYHLQFFTFTFYLQLQLQTCYTQF